MATSTADVRATGCGRSPTPCRTYAVPPWPARQEADFTHPAFRFHAERVIRRIVERYADHPAIILWQVGNQPGLHLFHHHGVFQRFMDHLREKYGALPSGLHRSAHGRPASSASTPAWPTTNSPTRPPTGCSPPASSRSSSPRPTPSPSASPGTTASATTASGARPPGRTWRAVRG
ncbi:beta-galactosidase [Streptomyces sp. NPDC049627]|uniref:beta-galactosidase n=1 Tax=Streptomyces sp. NPDC049627 TaxID=3365595 RepID=UPI0037AEC605